MDESLRWLSDLKPGDAVRVRTVYGVTLRVIDRVGKATITIGGTKFRRSDGFMVGGGLHFAPRLVPGATRQEGE